MSLTLRPQHSPDFMERWKRPTYVSNGVLSKLYCTATWYEKNAEALLPTSPPSFVYDPDLEVAGFYKFLDNAEGQYKAYTERLGTLMTTYSAWRYDEILTGNNHNKLVYQRRDNKCYCYFEMKDRIFAVVDARTQRWRWFEPCRDDNASKVASVWYHVTYHPDRCGDKRFWSF